MKRKFMESGWDQIPRFVLRMEEIGSSDKLVFSFIVNRMRDFGGGIAFPSIETIAANNALSKATVKRSTAALIKIGLLIRYPRGMGKTNEYCLPDEIPDWILEKYGADIVPKAQNEPPEGSKRAPGGIKKSRRKRVGEGEKEEGDPSGAPSEAPKSRGGRKKVPPEKGDGWSDSVPFSSPPQAQTVCAGGVGGKVMPWEREEEEHGLSRKRKGKKAKVRGLYDPSKSPSDWNGNDLVGYFRECFKRAFPGEGAPDVRIEDLGAAKRRIVWLRNEGVDVAVAKQAVDHLFANWGNGLPARIRWKGSRPGLAMVENARLFETIVREAQSGVGGAGTGDEFTAGDGEVERYKRRDEICKRLMEDEGKSLAEANREANRLVGLEGS
jgi:hypothetical protein